MKSYILLALLALAVLAIVWLVTGAVDVLRMP